MATECSRFIQKFYEKLNKWFNELDSEFVLYAHTNKSDQNLIKKDRKKKHGFWILIGLIESTSNFVSTPR